MRALFSLCPVASHLIRPLRSVHLYKTKLPKHVKAPPYITDNDYSSPSYPEIHNNDRLRDIREACQVVKSIFSELEGIIEPGISTGTIDDFVYLRCLSNGVYPSPLGYKGFPRSVCTSVNSVAVHGIPSHQDLLEAGDLVSVDISIYNGLVHGDACQTYVVGVNCGHDQPSLVSFCPDSVMSSIRPSLRPLASTDSGLLSRIKRALKLRDAALACRDAGISVCGPGVPFSAIGSAISKMAEQLGYLVVAGIAGHGLGTYLHGPPHIAHTCAEATIISQVEANETRFMRSGNVFTIEPCVTLPVKDMLTSKDLLGSSNLQAPIYPLVLPDGWSVVTLERTLCAQFEHTITIVDEGYQIFT